MRIYLQVNPADLYTALMGGRYGPDQRDPPFAAGHDGIGVVLKVRVMLPLQADRQLRTLGIQAARCAARRWRRWSYRALDLSTHGSAAPVLKAVSSGPLCPLTRPASLLPLSCCSGGCRRQGAGGGRLGAAVPGVPGHLA